MIRTRRTQDTKELLTVGRAEEMDVDPSDGKWVTLCEAHSTVVNTDTRTDAQNVRGLDFCDYCRREAGQDFGEWTNDLLDRDLRELHHARTLVAAAALA